MRRKRRETNVFSLAFLDIMSCGFGAVVLLFLIIKHQADVKEALPDFDLGLEMGLLQQDIGDAAVRAERARSRSAALDGELADSEAEAERLKKALKRAQAAATESPKPAVTAAEVDALKAQLKRMEAQKDQLLAQVQRNSRAVRTFTGDGNREYLTGLQFGGDRILILLDSSASMLDESIVNVIRRRNMDDASKRAAPKWRQALATVDWLTARLPQQSKYQIYTFDNVAQPALTGTAGRWLEVRDFAQLETVVSKLHQVVPGGGSSLARAMATINRLSPRPDNVYLITDGLPTQGLEGTRTGTVSGRERQRLFEQALQILPRNVPINAILLPMEGDPMAAWAFWGLALATRGSFISPSNDWP